MLHLYRKVLNVKSRSASRFLRPGSLSWALFQPSHLEEERCILAFSRLSYAADNRGRSISSTAEKTRSDVRLLRACAQDHRWQHALALFREAHGLLSESGGIHHYTMQACGRAAQWAYALAVLRLVQNIELEDGMSYDIAINAYGRGAQWERALVVLVEAHLRGYAPSLLGHSAAISACEKGSQVGFALRLLDEMPLLRLTPTVVSYNSAISALEKRGRWADAIGILGRMSRYHTRPDTVSFSAAISACARDAAWERAVALLSSMFFARVSRNVVSFSATMSACDKGSAWVHALNFLAEMRSANLEPNLVVFHTAMSACTGTASWSAALRVIADMEHHRIYPNAIGYTVALAACEAAMQRVRAAHLVAPLRCIAFNAALSSGGDAPDAVLHSAVASRYLQSQSAPDASTDFAAHRNNLAPTLTSLRALRHRMATLHRRPLPLQTALLRSRRLRDAALMREAFVRGAFDDLLVSHGTDEANRFAAHALIATVWSSAYTGISSEDLTTSLPLPLMPAVSDLAVGVSFQLSKEHLARGTEGRNCLMPEWQVTSGAEGICRVVGTKVR